MKAGYAHISYIESLSEYGTPRHLASSGTSLLVRAIPRTYHRDAMGPYPMCFCDDWTALGDDLKTQCEDLVSVVLVTEPFAPIDKLVNKDNYDLCRFFKKHYVADLSLDVTDIVKKSHRETARRASRIVEVKVGECGAFPVEKWMDLWRVLVDRHNIRGIKQFSKGAFELQFQIPGLVFFEALINGRTVGLDIWYQHDDVAYGHLVAVNEEGYRNRASYATKWFLINYFRDKVRWLDFGGGAGLVESDDDGLATFKKGWATEERPTFLLGKIMQPIKYIDLQSKLGIQVTPNYFPTYRNGEMM